MPELAPATLVAVDAYWAAFFGCDPTLFATATTAIVPHVGLGDYHGLWLFRRRDTLIVSLPVDRVEQERPALSTLSAAMFDDLNLIRARIGAPIERVIGPALVAYADRATFQPRVDAHTRLLTPSDQAAFEQFRQSCPALDWEHGGSTFGVEPVAGSFIGGMLGAIAGYEVWGDRIAHVAVVTHPDHRGQGHGKAAVSAIAQVALELGLTPQYRTLQRNAPSVALGAALGFVAYAEHIAMRLH